MKLGVFDSGLGGLHMTKALRAALPEHDILYFGDTLHLPYGNRSEQAIEYYTRRAMDAMFKQDCQLIVIACNTASAACLRRLQQTYLPEHWPDRNIIGVVVPTLEEAIERGYKNLGVIGTNYIVQSGIYQQELTKLDPTIDIQQVQTPLLVPMLENDGGIWLQDVLAHYLNQFDRSRLDCLLLGCTHYALLKYKASALLNKDIEILSQDSLIPGKLVDYLNRHPEHNNKINRNADLSVMVSDLTPAYKSMAHQIFDSEISIGVLET